MTIDLKDFEKGEKYAGDYADDLAKVQKRLAHIQVAHILHKRRAVVLLEGWDAAGKGGIIQRLTAEWDPRNFEDWPIKAPTDIELAPHFLWRASPTPPPPRKIKQNVRGGGRRRVVGGE